LPLFDTLSKSDNVATVVEKLGKYIQIKRNESLSVTNFLE